ncbi:MAG: VWA domain-containing protein [Acidobacteria bacterium]|nr:VWA domain-containing protein [Acidobacteriota bacterium]
MSPAHLRRLLSAVAVLAAVLAAPPGGRSQSEAEPESAVPEAVPEIAGGEIEQVTVDVVVLDKKGRPVTGLTQGDFTVLDEGEPQEIVSFELIDRQPGATDALPEARPRVVTNLEVATEKPGRTFVILFDDIHIAPLNAQPAKAAVAAFLDRGVVEGDRVTLVATSGSAWWSTRMKRGRDDLIAVLQRLDGRRFLEPATERITDYEAMQIVEYRNVLVARRVQRRMETYGTALQQPFDERDAANREEAWELFQRGVVDPYVESMASRTYLQAKTRLRKSLEAIERVVESLTEGRDKKALLLVSDGFIEDKTQPALKRVIEAARRVNATLYFIDSGGLRALSQMYSAEFGVLPDSRDTMSAIADLSAEGEGSAALADDTGGFSIRNTNAFDEGAVRIGRESQSYYLLGYVPGDIPRDGRFRKIKVKINGDYEIRARGGYYAPSDTPQPQRAYKEGVDPTLQGALDAASFADAIPLRMTAFVMEPTGLERSRAFVVADVDISAVAFADVEGSPVASLETLAVVAHRDSDDVQRKDQTVDIRRRPGELESPTWYSFVRDFEILPGEHQAKLVVRDTATDRVGSVVLELSAPPRDQLRFSTPILTDILNYPPGGVGGIPALITRRTFRSGAPLYCRFDVYGAATAPDGMPRVEAGYTLRRKGGGDAVDIALPSRIEPTSLGALARLLEIPLNGLAPGEYELVLTARDDVTGESRERVEPFSVAPTASARR